VPGVKKVFIRSGIRYDYLLKDKSGAFLDELVRNHVSGQLKVAPEHVSGAVLRKMGKPGADVFERFVQQYREANKRAGLEQYLVPYLMSSHPGSTLHDAVTLAEYLKQSGLRPEQVQDFYPTPGTMSTAMFFTGLDPRDMQRVYVARDPHEKAMQRALMQYFRPENRALVLEALKKAGRQDLIGTGPHCLVREMRPAPGQSGWPGQRGAPRKSGASRPKAGRGGAAPTRGGRPSRAPRRPASKKR
ncbi:MAG: DUF3362 domain-containing protein, partial [Eubacteriales bacterium]|nr:DUF3362 domain-containing protein [Eubacteriales bacterium]